MAVTRYVWMFGGAPAFAFGMGGEESNHYANISWWVLSIAYGNHSPNCCYVLAVIWFHDGTWFCNAVPSLARQSRRGFTVSDWASLPKSWDARVVAKRGSRTGRKFTPGWSGRKFDSHEAVVTGRPVFFSRRKARLCQLHVYSYKDSISVCLRNVLV